MARPQNPTIASLIAAAARAKLPKEITARDRLRSYAHDPVGFAREVLGIRLWKRQREILEAIRDGDRVAVVSGHKIGKSTVLAVAALWFYCSFPRSRVIITATTERQVDGIIWREVRWLVKQAERRGVKLPGADDTHLVARSGLKDPEDFAEIFGFTAREVEAVAGISAPHMLWLVDEASGVDDRIFEAIFGNMMGGAKIALISNPTKNTGEFARAFKAGSEYHCIQVSSLETPNCTGEEEPIPGLADPATIEKFREKWGEDSPQWKVRVLGMFVPDEEGKIFPLEILERANAAWREGCASEPEGVLVLALDPAGEKGEGDESGMGARRGQRVLALVGKRGLDEDGHIVWLKGLHKDHAKHPREPFYIVFDREGPIGFKLIGPIKAAFPNARIVPVRASSGAVRQPQNYGTIRDELFANLADRMRAGEAEIPEDKMLIEEMQVPKWEQDTKGKSKATPKKEMRKELGRSPDRLDTVCLLYWPKGADAKSMANVETLDTGARRERDWDSMRQESGDDANPFDPYAGA